MPKLWLCMGLEGQMYLSHEEPIHPSVGRVQVEINNSLFRQIKAAETKYYKFQDAMLNWYDQATDGRLKRISDGR